MHTSDFLFSLSYTHKICIYAILCFSFVFLNFLFFNFYNVVLVSAVQQCKSAIIIHISPPSQTFLPSPHRTPLGHHNRNSSCPCWCVLKSFRAALESLKKELHFDQCLYLERKINDVRQKTPLAFIKLGVLFLTEVIRVFSEGMGWLSKAGSENDVNSKFQRGVSDSSF